MNFDVVSSYEILKVCYQVPNSGFEQNTYRPHRTLLAMTYTNSVIACIEITFEKAWMLLRKHKLITSNEKNSQADDRFLHHFAFHCFLIHLR